MKIMFRRKERRGIDHKRLVVVYRLLPHDGEWFPGTRFAFYGFERTQDADNGHDEDARDEALTAGERNA